MSTRPYQWIHRFKIDFLIFVTLSVLWAVGAQAQDTQVKPGEISLTVGKSTVLQTDRPAKRVSMGNPEIADHVVISPKEIYVVGKSPGTTNMTIWQDGRATVYDIEVGHDISRLKQRLNEVLPLQKDLQVMAAHDTITLSGRVTSASDLSQAIAVARAYAPEGKVENLIQVGGVHQVMLEVRVAEMQKSLLRRLGVNFNYTTTSGKFGISTLGGLTEAVSPGDGTISTPGPFGIVQSAVVNAMLRFTSSGATWTGFIDALKEEGLLKVLAEPNLIALSGQEANFLAGGEFPVPVPQGLGTVGIEYKPFGVGLNFTPTVLNEDKISIKVAPEVSELDFSVAVRVEGFVVPGLSTRKASTVVELADGQSFAIAGLLRDTVRDSVSKFPVLGDIPVLGALFRSRSFQRNETELVIIVTPHLVKPLNEMKQALPTDYYRVPTDTEFYVENLMVGRPRGPQGKMEGEFGHVVPKPTD
jgi:pilus assembly protein CpaC